MKSRRDTSGPSGSVDMLLKFQTVQATIVVPVAKICLPISLLFAYLRTQSII